MVYITDPSENLVEGSDSLPRTMHLISAARDLAANDPKGAVWWPWNAGAGGPGVNLPLRPSLISL